jgi:transposase-like protein
MLKTYNSRALHSSLILYKPYECVFCGNTGKHNNLPLKLQVDHIDGNNSNNILDNLRFLCPNCHSQTSTYSGKNAKFKNYVKPSKEEFLELYKNFSIKEISIIKAVSVRVVYQWFKYYIKDNNPTRYKKRKLSCDQVLEIRSSTDPSEKLVPVYKVSSKLIRQIRRYELYKNCN